jgi:phage/plasmid-associated DNA primase
MPTTTQRAQSVPPPDLVEEFGPPAYRTSRGAITRLNENFWAGYYAQTKTRIIFEPDEQEFYEYDPETGIFVVKTVDAIRTELSALILAAAKEWRQWGGVATLRNANHLTGMISHLRGQMEELRFFNVQSNLVHLANCTLKFSPDGNGWIPEPFSPEHRSRNRSPICYDAKAACPEFEKMILGHLPQEDREVLQKYSGQCLLGKNISQRFLILDGIGGSSKGTFILILTGIIGEDNVYELRPKLLEERFEIGRMMKHTLLSGSDVEGDFLNARGGHLVKSIIGGDVLEAENKNSNKDRRGYWNVLFRRIAK